MTITTSFRKWKMLCSAPNFCTAVQPVLEQQVTHSRSQTDCTCKSNVMCCDTWHTLHLVHTRFISALSTSCKILSQNSPTCLFTWCFIHACIHMGMDSGLIAVLWRNDEVVLVVLNDFCSLFPYWLPSCPAPSFFFLFFFKGASFIHNSFFPLRKEEMQIQAYVVLLVFWQKGRGSQEIARQMQKWKWHVLYWGIMTAVHLQDMILDWDSKTESFSAVVKWESHEE